jgi:hypothetical protein
MARKSFLWIGVVLAIFVGTAGCAIPVREIVKVDLTAPVGTIEGNQFTGIRYPFRVAAPPGWKISTQYPEFMVDLGYDKEGLEESQVFIFNPGTQSNLQIELSPAGRYATFDQEKIEWLTTSATGTFKQELEDQYGKEVAVTIAPTTAYPLKGVSFAAKKYAVYTVKGVKWEQGWIYGFTEPYQIFVLYMAQEKEGTDDVAAIKQILDSFAVTPK